MRTLFEIVIALVVAILIAWLGCVLVDSAKGAPAQACTIIWIVALLAWIIFSFGGYFTNRAPPA